MIDQLVIETQNRVTNGAIVTSVATELSSTCALIRRFVALRSDAELHAIALWVLHTHAVDAAEATPYIWITSPEKRSGKTRLLEVLEALCSRPLQMASISEAALFRSVA